MTFIMPINGKHESLVEQISAVFNFSEVYDGFCEIVIVANATESSVGATLKLAELATRLGKTTHPHVRTRIIRVASSQSLNMLINIGIDHALGQKIMILTDGLVGHGDCSYRSGSDSFGRSVLKVDTFAYKNEF